MHSCIGAGLDVCIMIDLSLVSLSSECIFLPKSFTIEQCQRSCCKKGYSCFGGAYSYGGLCYIIYIMLFQSFILLVLKSPFVSVGVYPIVSCSPFRWRNLCLCGAVTKLLEMIMKRGF